MKPSHMNMPPEEFVPVPHERLEALVDAIGQAAGLPADKAALLARLLVGNDLKGVFSHGSRQIADYARLMRDGHLNPRPQVHVVHETPQTVLVDGDGGLGYFPAHDATLRAIEKAEATGMAVATTRNHGHFGAAGIYARMTLGHDLLTFVTSGHQLNLQPGDRITGAGGGSPMAFTAPAGEEDGLVLDFGTMHDFYDADAYRDELVRTVPGLVLRHVGMGAICQTWGGLLAGIPLDPHRAERRFDGANQGSLLMAFRISLFMPAERFKQEMDEYVRAVRRLEPLPPFSESYLPGGIEVARERQYRAEGVPVGAAHRDRLAAVAAEFGIAVPW
ncbi:MAG: Ldh family oxidoreductase [Anaerolineae bacterium]